MSPRTLARLIGTIGIVIAAFTTPVQAQDRAYVTDSRNEVARSGFGLCWRTGYWTPAAAASDAAGCACDKDLLPREKCEPAKAAPAPQAMPTPAPAAPAAAPAPAPKPVILSANELFAFDKAILSANGKTLIDKEIFEKLKNTGPVTFVQITGHTDRIGTHSYNQKLSEKRADAVKAYLLQRGISEDKIDTMGAGKTQPLGGAPACDDKLPRAKLIECLAPHRRVEVQVKTAPK